MSSAADVLIIEPSYELAQVMAEAFSRRDLSSIIASSAQEAIAAADETTPRLVIIEPIMPRHNGLEFIYEFRSYPEWLDIPIIFYTQLSPDELGAQAMLNDMGVKEHLYKPTTSLKKLVESAENIFASINI